MMSLPPCLLFHPPSQPKKKKTPKRHCEYFYRAGTRTLGNGAVVPTWEIAEEVALLRSTPIALVTNLTVSPDTAVPIKLPTGASGQAIELRLNVSYRCGNTCKLFEFLFSRLHKSYV